MVGEQAVVTLMRGVVTIAQVELAVLVTSTPQTLVPRAVTPLVVEQSTGAT